MLPKQLKISILHEIDQIHNNVSVRRSRAIYYCLEIRFSLDTLQDRTELTQGNLGEHQQKIFCCWCSRWSGHEATQAW